MKKIPVDPFEMAPQILKALPKGILMTTRADERTDTMVIGWGTLGIDWSIPVFTAFVRESRYTKELVDANPFFTVNIPMDTPDLARIIKICGTRSGRDINKFQACHLDLVETDFPVPAIAQLPLTLECEVIYIQDQDPKAIDPAVLERCYPQGDFHTAYTARITSAYLLQQE